MTANHIVSWTRKWLTFQSDRQNQEGKADAWTYYMIVQIRVYLPEDIREKHFRTGTEGLKV